MKIQYITADTEVGVAYIAIGDKTREEHKGIVADTKEAAPGVLLDYDKDGNLVGVEIF
jgi:uncharacterized protein YuzE